MSTANKLWTDVSGWTRSLGANTAYTADTTDWAGDNSDDYKTTGKNKSNANFLEISGTWESLFGIAANSTVTLIGTPDDFDWQCKTFTTGAASTAGPLELRDSGGTLLLTLAAGASYSATTTRATKAGTQQSVPGAQQPSNTTIRFRLNSTQATGSSTSAVNELLLGHVNITITYTTNTILTASAGSYGLTGNADASKNVAVDASGAYALSGVAAKARTALIDSHGVYTVSGAAATLTTSGGGSVTLNAASGAYTLSGKTDVVRQAFKSPTAGTYGIVGASDIAKILALAAKGAYALSGAAVTIPHSWLPGTYGVAGRPTTLVVSGVPTTTDPNWTFHHGGI